MQPNQKTLCVYRLERAKEDLAVQLEHAEAFIKAVEEYIYKNGKEVNA